MIYLETGSTDPFYNLAFEEYVFEKLDRSKQYFILWQNSNTIVVGKFQNTVEEIDKKYVDEHGIRVVRRLSGGGAVYHDMGNLNFTFIVDKEHTPDLDFAVFIQPVIQVLKSLDVPAEFNSRNDITIEGQKFSGNSQYLKKDRLLHHGTLLLDSDLSMVVGALNVRPVKIQSKGIKSVRSRVTNITPYLKTPITMEEFKTMLMKHILQNAGLTRGELSEGDLREVRRLRDEKYATWEWNYGASPDYNLKKERKFPAGLVSVYLLVEKGYIKSIRFYGDFFGNGELSDFENRLVGAPINVGLEARLEACGVGNYMHGITARNLYELITY